MTEVTDASHVVDAGRAAADEHVSVLEAEHPRFDRGAGGALETVRPGETGLFFHRQDARSLADAILEAEKIDFDPAKCRQNAAGFAPEKFRAAFRAALRSEIPEA